MAFNNKNRMDAHQTKGIKLDAIDILSIGMMVAGIVLMWFALSNLI